MVRRMDYEFCSGLGFDVHSFSEEPTETIRLCGVDIRFHKKLKGHSDADVALHALSDALYGAIGAGDIGQHFPPSNDEFKDMDSVVFLEHALSLVRAEKGELVNADITLICEEPKIGPYRPYIKERLAALLYLDKRRVNIKATTTELLGFTGRKEGIAAQAIVSIAIPID